MNCAAATVLSLSKSGYLRRRICGRDPYYYSTLTWKTKHFPAKAKVVVLGAGPIRIGQGIEFDYCSVHASWALREEGVRSIMINNNPETVSTDFDTCDRFTLNRLSLRIY